jgi:hypothetical protein
LCSLAVQVPVLPFLARRVTSFNEFAAFPLLPAFPVARMLRHMKSAYERAMERFGGESDSPKLTEEQKAQIAEINNIYEAKIAERQTFLKSKIAAARATDSHPEVDQLETQLASDVYVLKEEWEAKKAKVWKSA